MPYVEWNLVRHLVSRSDSVDVVVPIVRGYYEPLCAVYRTTCLNPIENLIEHSVLKVSELYDIVRSHEVSEQQVRQHDPEFRSFVNLNVPTEIKTAGQAGRLDSR